MNNAEFFRDVTLRIAGDLEIAPAMHSVFAYLRSLLPLDTLRLIFVDEENDRLSIIARVDHKGVNAPEDHDLGTLSPEFVAWIEKKMYHMLDKQCECVNYPYPDPDLSQLISRMPGISDLDGHSLMVVNLRLQERDLGKLIFSSVKPQAYTNEHLDLVRQLNDPFALALTNALRYRELERLHRRLQDDNRQIQLELAQRTGDQVVGSDFGLRGVMQLVRQVAPLSSPVLLLGETGTGKEVIAQTIHQFSDRREGPLVRVQCGAIPDSLLDSELFGHEAGAFTGAISTQRGRFERAHGGTIFLDEIGELTLPAQVKLLRILQEKEFERLGSAETRKVDVRVIAATHRDLPALVRAGQFREDLWFRLNVFPILLPPLRERIEDLPVLVQHFIRRKGQEMGLSTLPLLRAEDLELLRSYNWPGNVRELQNIIERSLILGGGRELALPPLRLRESPSTGDVTQEQKWPDLDSVIRRHIRDTLNRCHGRISGKEGAASVLGVNASTLRSRMKKLGIASPH